MHHFFTDVCVLWRCCLSREYVWIVVSAQIDRCGNHRLHKFNFIAAPCFSAMYQVFTDVCALRSCGFSRVYAWIRVCVKMSCGSNHWLSKCHLVAVSYFVFDVAFLHWFYCASTVLLILWLRFGLAIVRRGAVKIIIAWISVISLQRYVSVHLTMCSLIFLRYDSSSFFAYIFMLRKNYMGWDV